MASIQFGIIADTANTVNKSFTPSIVLDGTFRDDLDILNPVFRVETDVTDYNYIYIEELKRYYYIRDIVIESNEMYRVECHVDVLKTYATQIMNMTNESTTRTYEFESKFGDNMYIVTGV